MDYFKASETRKSIREFKASPVSENQINEIRTYFKESKSLIAGIETELVVVSAGIDNIIKANAGYQGLTFDAPCYLLLLSEVKNGYIENAGYRNEGLILKAVSMGLDCCWLTVDDGEAMKKALQIDTDKQVVTVTALGYGKEEKMLLTSHIKNPSNVEFTKREGHVAPKISLSELIYEGEWEQKAELGEERVDSSLRNAFYAASYAPTFLNRQSYRFIMDAGTVVLVKILDALTGEFDARLNCGATIFNFTAVLSQYRPYETEWIIGEPKKSYIIPANCEIMGYCNI